MPKIVTEGFSDKELKAKVISGEIVVPSTPDTFAEWMK
jgi:hypothetical protein